MADADNPNGGNGASNASSGNGKNGGKVGILEKVTTGVKEDIQALKTDIPTKAKEQIEGLKDPTKTQVYTSIFRHKHDDTPRNRALGVLSNVFLHLHPAKINRDAVRYSYTWGMGGITFFLFIILTYTGVLLMFYYHPSKVQAFRDVLYLEHDVPFGKILAEHAPLGRALDGHRRMAAHVPRVPDRLLQKAAGIQLEHRRTVARVHPAALVHRLSAAGRSTRFLGRNSRNEYGARDSAART